MGLRYFGSAIAWKEPNFHENGGVSVTHIYLSRIFFSEAGSAKPCYTGVTEMGFSGLIFSSEPISIFNFNKKCKRQLKVQVGVIDRSLAKI
jgi:hypothetical protein